MGENVVEKLTVIVTPEEEKTEKEKKEDRKTASDETED